MFNPLFILAIGVMSLIYVGINYYIGLRGWHSLFSHFMIVPHNLYWGIFWFVALAYLLARLGEKVLPAIVDNWLKLIGSYWLGLMFYFILVLLTIDVVRLANHWLRFIPPALIADSRFGFISGIVVTVAVFGTVAYGAWNAQHPVVQHYDVSIAKKAGNLNKMHIVMVSDIHLGTIVGNSQLTKMVSMINSLHPDLIVFPGDVIDESVQPFVEKKMAAHFRQLRAKYGVFSILGNHEYIDGHDEEVSYYLGTAGVRVLRDETVKVADSVYLTGREDRLAERFAGKKRQDIAKLTSNLDHSLPLIVLDHQPSHLEEPEMAGIDLQLSGHTHRGQLFPNQWITSRIFEDDWGLLRKGEFNLIVSSGFGTWGPPIRVGNKPEIVDVTVHFTAPKN